MSAALCDTASLQSRPTLAQRALYRATTQRLTRREASEITPSMTLLFRSTVFLDGLR